MDNHFSLSHTLFKIAPAFLSFLCGRGDCALKMRAAIQK
ncbi:mCG140173 [Mus musculus]|nr:mCG140173 [Mus musculus]